MYARCIIKTFIRGKDFTNELDLLLIFEEMKYKFHANKCDKV